MVSQLGHSLSVCEVAWSPCMWVDFLWVLQFSATIKAGTLGQFYGHWPKLRSSLGHQTLSVNCPLVPQDGFNAVLQFHYLVHCITHNEIKTLILHCQRLIRIKMLHCMMMIQMCHIHLEHLPFYDLFSPVRLALFVYTHRHTPLHTAMHINPSFCLIRPWWTGCCAKLRNDTSDSAFDTHSHKHTHTHTHTHIYAKHTRLAQATSILSPYVLGEQAQLLELDHRAGG